jgi:putative inorganic carbon (HCO3(-)) transporter
MRGSRRVAWWALVAMVFVVPIAMSNLTFLGFKSPFTYDQFDIVKVFFERLLGLVALGAWGWALLRRGGKVRRTPIDWLVLAFLVWAGFTTLTSIHPPTALFGTYHRYEGFLSFVNYAVIYFLILQFADSPARVRTLAKSLFWSSVIVTGYGVLQYAGLDPIHWGPLPFETHRAFSTYGNPDLLGGFLMFSVPVAMGLALAEQNLVWRLIYWAGLALNVVVLIVTFTRGAWIGGVIGLLILAVIAWRHHVKLRIVDWLPASVTAAIAVAIVWRSLSNGGQVMNFGRRLASILQFSGGSGKTRTEIWQAALTAIEKRPIQGWGADTFKLVFEKFKPMDYVRDAGSASVADNAHNYPLELAAGIGIVGMLMMYGIFIWAAVRSFGTVFKRTNDPHHILLGAFWAAAAGYLVQLMFAVSVTGNTFLLWAAIGIVLAPTARVVTVRSPKRGMVAGLAVVVVVALGAGYQFVPLIADHDYLVSLDSAGAAHVTAVQEAVRLNPYNGQYRAAVGVAYVDQIMANLNAGAKAQKAGQSTAAYATAIRGEFAAGEAAFQNAIAYVPYEYDYWVFFASFYNLAGQVINKSFYSEAINVAERGIQVERYGPAIRIQLARALIATGKTGAAASQLQYCLRLDPTNSQAGLLLAGVYARAGHPGEALAVLKAVNAAMPGQPGVATAIQQIEASSTVKP